jgi:hypothetical protein
MGPAVSTATGPKARLLRTVQTEERFASAIASYQPSDPSLAPRLVIGATRTISGALEVLDAQGSPVGRLSLGHEELGLVGLTALTAGDGVPRIVAGCPEPGRLRVWHGDSLEELPPIGAHAVLAVLRVCRTNTGTGAAGDCLLTGGNGGEVRMWGGQGLTPLLTIPGWDPLRRVTALALTADGSQLLVGYEGHVRADGVWAYDAATGGLLHEPARFVRQGGAGDGVHDPEARGRDVTVETVEAFAVEGRPYLASLSRGDTVKVGQREACRNRAPGGHKGSTPPCPWPLVLHTRCLRCRLAHRYIDDQRLCISSSGTSHL